MLNVKNILEWNTIYTTTINFNFNTTRSVFVLPGRWSNVFPGRWSKPWWFGNRDDEDCTLVLTYHGKFRCEMDPNGHFFLMEGDSVRLVFRWLRWFYLTDLGRAGEQIPSLAQVDLVKKIYEIHGSKPVESGWYVRSKFIPSVYTTQSHEEKAIFARKCYPIISCLSVCHYS